MLSGIGSLVGLALFFALAFEFLRGMQALREIATSLKRIEDVLSKESPGARNPPASQTAT